MKDKTKGLNLIQCPKCKYNNKPENVKFYGTCRLCDSVLDEKAKYKYEMNKRLRLWRGKLK